MAVHIYTQTIYRTTQITTNVEECGPCPVFASFTLAFALQLRKKHGKTSVRVRETSVSTSIIVYKFWGHNVDWNTGVWSSAGKYVLTLTNTDTY